MDVGPSSRSSASTGAISCARRERRVSLLEWVATVALHGTAEAIDNDRDGTDLICISLSSERKIHGSPRSSAALARCV